MSMEPNRHRADTDLDRLLIDIFGETVDPVLEDPHFVEQILQAIDTTSNWQEVQAKFPELWAQLEQDPEMRAAYELFVELEQSWESEPSDVSSPATPVVDLVRAALEKGQQWAADALGNVVLAFGPAWSLAADGAMLKAHDPEGLRVVQPLSQISFADPTLLGGWDITVTTYAEELATCRIEVSLFSGDLEANLDGIAVTLQHNGTSLTQETDEDGIVLFTGIARDIVERALLHIQLAGAHP
jgi:hypothetical protein